MIHEDRSYGLIDLGAASAETKGSFFIDEDTEVGLLPPAGLIEE